MYVDQEMAVDRNDRSAEQQSLVPRIVLPLAVAAAVIELCSIWLNAEPAKSASPQHATPAIPVQALVVNAQPVDLWLTALGTVQAWNTATVTPQVSGQVTELPFQEGSLIHAGDIVVRIDPRTFQAALDQAQAKKAQDAANLAAAQKNLSRDQALLTKGGFATQQTVDNEQAQVEADKAMIAGDQAAIETSQLNLDFATIRAPFTGIIGLSNIDIGNVVSQSTSIVTITQIEPTAVEFTLPQAHLSEVQAAFAQGKPAVLVSDQNGKTLLARGSLDVINNEVDSTSGTIKLKARFDNKDHKLWPGAFVQVRVVTGSVPDAIAVPSQAVQRGPSGSYVWLVSSDHTVRPQAVELGQIQDDRTVITGGLSAGDRIVVAGQYRLTPGARVSETDPAQVAQAQDGQP
jgi:multidrug efflux system membrane fusion protein